MKEDNESYNKIILHISRIVRISKLNINVGINLKFLFKVFLSFFRYFLGKCMQLRPRQHNKVLVIKLVYQD
jgi:hypothetical protein